MAATDLTKAAYIFKRTYAKRQMPDSAKRKHPWLMRIAKNTNWTGKNEFNYSVKHTNPQGFSATFSTAKANASGTAGEQFSAARKKLYGYGTIDGEALEAARDDNGAFVRLVRNEVDGALAEHEDTMALQLFRDGNAWRGEVSAVPVGNDIVLKSRNSTRWFKKNMVLIASVNANGSAPRAGTMKVTAVNYGTKTVTVDALVAGTTTNDYLFRQGEEGLAMEGMQAILPSTPGTFRGVPVTTDRERLGGVYVNDPSSTIERNAAEVMMRVHAVSGATPDTLILNTIKAQEVCERNGAKITYDGNGDKAMIGFGTFIINTAAGPIRVLPDPDCPITDGFLVTPDTWELRSMRPCPHVYDDDTMRYLRVNDDDAIEFRTRSFCNVICYAPAENGRFTITE